MLTTTRKKKKKKKKKTNTKRKIPTSDSEGFRGRKKSEWALQGAIKKEKGIPHEDAGPCWMKSFRGGRH